MTDITYTPDQQNALVQLKNFIAGKDRCMILRGYAGTGKTFLIGQIAKQLQDDHINVVLLAPTGRAARVITQKTGIPAHTIHRHIYNLDDLVEHDEEKTRFRFYFQLKTTAVDDTNNVVIVDESSMISDRESDGEFIRFGSGRLLYDLIQYTRLQDPTQKTRIIFVGDDAQLPPVNMNNSPALDIDYLASEYQLAPVVGELTQVVRQAATSKVLEVATAIRENIRLQRFNQLMIKESPPEIITTESTEVAILWKASHKHQLPPPFICITFSNDAALRYNLSTRAALWGGNGEETVRPGDFLMIITNNRLTGLLNGDIVLVLDSDPSPVIRHVPLMIDGQKVPIELRFRKVEIGYDSPEHGKMRQKVRILENVLYSDRRDITPEEQRSLFVDFRIRNPGLRPNTNTFTEAILQDEYFNALKVKFGYAGTCYKAQGGEWPSAVVVFDNHNTDLSAQRWAYTAVTRAKDRVYLVNPPSRGPWDGLFENPQTANTTEDSVNPHDLPPPPAKSENVMARDFNLPETAPASLIERHNAILRCWKENGISVTDMTPRVANHHIKYHTAKEDRQAVVTIYFNGNHEFTTLQLQPVQDADEELCAQVKTLFENLPGDISFPPDQPHLKELYEREVRPRAEAIGYQVLEVKHQNYAERYSLRHPEKGLSVVDFYYDGRGRFTKIRNISGENPFQAG